MAHTWDPRTYLAYGDERARPFHDLLARVACRDAELVVDLGCGPGTLTATLAERWPRARVHGVDASAEMVAQARRAGGARLAFEQADLAAYRPPGPVDVLVSNAALQWVPGHLDLIPALAALVRPAGWLAFQVPGNFDAPSHTILRTLMRDGRFAARLRDVRLPASHEPRSYLDRLLDLGARAEVWETTYLHVLHGPDPVLRWVTGTGARPVLQTLPEAERAQFEAEYAAALRKAYPSGAHGTVLPFRRIFAVAQLRPEGDGAVDDVSGGGSRESLG